MGRGPQRDPDCASLKFPRKHLRGDESAKLFTEERVHEVGKSEARGWEELGVLTTRLWWETNQGTGLRYSPPPERALELQRGVKGDHREGFGSGVAAGSSTSRGEGRWVVLRSGSKTDKKHFKLYAEKREKAGNGSEGNGERGKGQL